MKSQNFCTYILTNYNNTTLYIGCTNNLERRMSEHKDSTNTSSFVKKYNLSKLVYYETYSNMADAIQREKQMKGWKRYKKIELITISNPEWLDLNYFIDSSPPKGGSE